MEIESYGRIFKVHKNEIFEYMMNLIISTVVLHHIYHEENIKPIPHFKSMTEIIIELIGVIEI